MTAKQNEIGSLALYIELAREGSAEAVDRMISGLTPDMSFAQSRFIDYALGRVTSEEGVERIGWYLFHGTQIQRNYATLFFNRRCAIGDWERVKKAYRMGLVDATQAFSK